MVSFGDNLRMTAEEWRGMATLVGALPIPRTVTAHNRICETAAQLWEEDGSAEGKLLAVITRGYKICN